MSVLLEDPFYRSAATAGAAAACILSLLPLLGDGYQLLRGRLSSRSRSSSSNSSGSKTGVAAARGVHTSPKTLAFRLTLVVPVYALTSLLAFLYCSPLNSLPAAAPAAAAAAAAVPAASGALSSASAAAAGAQELSPRAAVAAAAAAATALQQRSGGWIGLWLRGAREGYEVYALYAFLELLIALLGGEQQAVNQLHLKVCCCCCCCCCSCCWSCWCSCCCGCCCSPCSWWRCCCCSCCCRSGCCGGLLLFLS